MAMFIHRLWVSYVQTKIEGPAIFVIYEGQI